MTRSSVGADRDAPTQEIPGLWWAAVPGTRVNSIVVVVSYFVDAQRHRVQLNAVRRFLGRWL